MLKLSSMLEIFTVALAIKNLLWATNQGIFFFGNFSLCQQRKIAWHNIEINY
ncbi:hypothetical protein [Megamonas hypermegale]|uniref:hypothetical protein n=1 Tax=Megamonas hypermegale TaxID=158847 RepID=UPI0013A64AFC|nr:hypothetical protein [Megamonas hypermegale]